MKMKILTVILSCSLFSPAFAYYCATQSGNGFIDIGDSEQAVAQACGQPTNKEQQKIPQTETQQSQYWVYQNAQIDQSVGLNVNGPTRSVQRSGPSATVTVQNGVVTDIQQGSGDSGCMSNIQKGDSTDQLLSACGKPDNVSVQAQQQQLPDKTMDVWTYDRGDYSTPLTLEFESGALTNITE